jgi:hypothetical protein
MQAETTEAPVVVVPVSSKKVPLTTCVLRTFGCMLITQATKASKRQKEALPEQSEKRPVCLTFCATGLCSLSWLLQAADGAVKVEPESTRSMV